MIWHINIVFFFLQKVLGDLVGYLKVWQMQSDVNVDGCQAWELGAKNYDSHSLFMCVEFRRDGLFKIESCEWSSLLRPANSRLKICSRV